jgi:exodeoxyribonuclease III
MRVATWNVNSVTARLPRLLEWLPAAGIDVACLQETKVPTDGFPYAEVEAAGWQVAHHGEGRWNGVAILSRVGLDDVVRGFPGVPGFPDDTTIEARAITATTAGLRITSVYVPNGREPDNPHYDYKLRWLTALADAIGPDVAGPLPYAVVGDYNVAPTDADVWDPAKFVGATHVTEGERAALTRLRELGLHDVVPRIAKGRVFSYWDYRGGSFHKGEGMRIDLVYGNDAFAGAVRDAVVDREMRKGTGPSDHAPVVVDLDLG